MDFQVVCADGIKWCQKHKGLFPAIVTSAPDMSEVNKSEAAYIKFFRRCAAAVFGAVSDDGYAIFIQTDRKSNGLIDKSYLITDEAHNAGFRLMYHKIALIRDVDATDLYKPTFSHVLCYSKKGTPGSATPDVFMRGDVLYTNGMGIEATRRVLEFLKTKHIDHVVDPFVGRGTTLIVAKHMGFKGGIGVDLDKKQCDEATKNLTKTFAALKK
jgi:hypothetical protein